MNVAKPKNRSALRKYFARKYYIIKRRISWLRHKKKYAQIEKNVHLKNSLIKHKSLLLRPLKDVEMYLQHNKVKNLELAIKRINRVVIKPGQIFSVWYLVGRPSKRKGYIEGLVLNNGRIDKGTGGGLCQLGNLIYWMALHSPLTIKERWRHSFDVFPDINRSIPFGCGATLAYNYIDLQLENNTDQNFQIHLWLDKEYLNGEITCNLDKKLRFEIVEAEHSFNVQAWGGYTRHNKIIRKTFTEEDQILAEEIVAENNAIIMYNPLLENNPDKK